MVFMFQILSIFHKQHLLQALVLGKLLFDVLEKQLKS